MSWQDAVNAVFEFSGSIAVWLNVRAIYRDRGYAGGRIYVNVFFFSWSWWNLYYYPHLGQMLSAIGTMSIGFANMAYLIMMLHFGRKQ
jgi:hypothetical protein